MVTRREEVLMTKSTKYCDFCGKKSGQIARCIGCKQDVCGNCCEFLYNDPWYGDSNGDYPERVCTYCSRNLEKYSKEAAMQNRILEEKIEGLKKQWLKECEDGRID